MNYEIGEKVVLLESWTVGLRSLKSTIKNIYQIHVYNHSTNSRNQELVYVILNKWRTIEGKYRQKTVELKESNFMKMTNRNGANS